VDNPAPVTPVVSTQQAPATPSANSLPFTGYDVVPVAIIGLLLLAAGGLVLRTSRRSSRD
jgi:LPXTG-motif cell wall-anchored protein